jgi:hypothetical protein
MWTCPMAAKIFLTPDKAHLHRFDDKGLRLT